MKPQRGIVVGGRYRLDRPLARGGMGTIWAATHLELDSQVAIKFLDDMRTTDVESQLRFRREARATARLRSPNIVQIHDFGVEEQRRFIVMELLQGEDLGARLRRTPRLPFSTVRSIVCQVAKALDRVHAAGIVHRDIKPGNIFLTRSDDGDDVVKLVDFGLVHFQAQDQTQTPVTISGVVLGTPHFMAPEQARDCAKVDHRSDLWSLAAVAYRALTGEPVVAGTNVVEVLMHIARRSIRPPSVVAPDLSDSIDRFFEKALALSPDERFQSASELARAFVGTARDPRASVAAMSAPQIDASEEEQSADISTTSLHAESSMVPTPRYPRVPSDLETASDDSMDAGSIARAAAKYTSLKDDDFLSDDEIAGARPKGMDQTEGSMTLPRLDVSNGPDARWRVAAVRADARKGRLRIAAASLGGLAVLALAAFTIDYAGHARNAEIARVSPGAEMQKEAPRQGGRAPSGAEPLEAPPSLVEVAHKPEPASTAAPTDKAKVSARTKRNAEQPAKGASVPVLTAEAQSTAKPLVPSEVF